MDKVRIDKWLWAARFYKTRSLATDEVNKGRVSVSDQVVKPSREVKVGELIALRRDGLTRTVQVLAISDKRGSATVAQLLYAETPSRLSAQLNLIKYSFPNLLCLSI